jgi:NitT/TauT family transport system substrate-binding protein
VLEDLKNVAGMKVALSVASTGEYFFDMLLKDVGLSSEDVELINASAPARMEGLMTGGLDIVSGSEPWNTRIMNAGVGDNWIGYEDIFPNFPFSIMMYGPKLLEENREVGERFMVAFLKAVKIYSEGKTDRNVEIIAKYTELDPEEVKQSCWQPIKLDGTINVQSILDFQDWAISKGYVEDPVTVEQFWDPEFIEYAQQQLK